jgi:hypothetical protein
MLREKEEMLPIEEIAREGLARIYYWNESSLLLLKFVELLISVVKKNPLLKTILFRISLSYQKICNQDSKDIFNRAKGTFVSNAPGQRLRSRWTGQAESQ